MKVLFRPAVFFLVLTGVAGAAVISWKGTLSDGVFGTSTNWVGNVAPASTDSVLFGASTLSAVMISANTSVTGITFDNTGGAFPPYVFSTANSSKFSIGSGGISVATGGATTVGFSSSLPIGLTADQTWTVGAAVTLTVAGEVSGAFNLIKAGGGTLSLSTLSGTNTYTGTTTISSGYVLIAADSGLGQAPASPTPNSLTLDGGSLATSANVTLHANRGVTLGAGNASFDAGSGTTLTIAGAVSGPGQLYVNPTGGTLVLSGANSFSGAATVFGGGTGTTLRASHATALGSTAAGTTVGIGATLDINGAAIGPEPVTLSGAGVGGLGALTGTGTASLAGPVALSGSATVGGTGTLTLSGTIGETGGPSALTKVGAGTLVLSNTTSYTGGTTVSAGTLTIAGGASVITGNILNNAALVFDRGPTGFDYTGQITGSGSLKKSGTGQVYLLGSNSFTGGTTIDGGFVTIGGGSTTGTLGGNVVLNTGELQFFRADAYAATGSITGTGNVSNYGGLVTLSGTNTYVGNTFVQSIVPSVTAVLADGSAGAFSPNTTMRIATGATLQVNQSQSIAGLNDFAASTSGSVMIGSGATLTLSNVAANTFSGVASGAGMILKKGTGTLTLRGGNTFTGGTTIQQGALRLADSGALATTGNVSLSPLAGSSATFDVNGLTRTIGALEFSGAATNSFSTVLIGAGTLTLGGDVTYNAANNPGMASIPHGRLNLGVTRTFNIGDSSTASPDLRIAAEIQGTGAGIIKTGGGTLELIAANSYTGPTTIHDGKLELFAGATLASGTAITLNQLSAGKTARFVIGNNTQSIGTLNFAGATPTSDTEVTIGTSGMLTLGGTVTFNEANNPLGADIIGGTVNLGGATRTFDIGNSTSASNDLTISSAVTGGAGAGIRKTGAGQLFLSGNNTYAGTTLIENGTISLGSSTALPAAANVVLEPVSPHTGASLFVGSNTVSIGDLTFRGHGSLTTTSASVGPGGVLALSGAVIFDASNAPSIADISGGQLGLGATDRIFNIQDSGSTNVELGINSQITGTGGILKTGAGTLSLNNTSNNYTGATWIKEGKIVVLGLAASGANSRLGAGSLIRLGSDNLSGTLEVSGSSTTTNRTIDLGGTTGGGTLLANSSAAITFSGNVTASGAGSKTLTLGGFASLATLSGSIADNSATSRTSVTKQNFGTWTLSGANTYTGTTTVTSGTLRTTGSGTFGVGSNVEMRPTDQGYASLELTNTQQTIGSLHFGGSGYSAVSLNTGGVLTLGGSLSYGISDEFSFPGSADIYGGTLALGTTGLVGGARVFHVEDSINAYTEVSVFSTLSGTVPIKKTGSGALYLGGNSPSFSGGIQVTEGQLFLYSNSAAGSGPLQMFSGTRLAPRHSHVELTNSVTLANNTFLGDYDDERSLTFAGTVTLQPAVESNVAVLNLDRETQIRFGGSLTAPAGTTLYFVGSGPALFSGPTSANIGTIWTTGPSLGFLTTRALPTSLGASSGAYVGVIATSPEFLSEVAPGAVAADPVTLLGRIAAGVDAQARAAAAASFGGTVGFDSDEDHLKAPAVFGQTLDFTNFTHPDFAVGSASIATLSGTIKPVAVAPGQFNYAFGNGGGMLVVQSNLTGNSSVTVSSLEDRSLTTVLRGNNSFTGSLNIYNSAVILDSARALPVNANGGPTGSNVSLSGGLMYFGATEARATAAETVSLFANVVSNFAEGGNVTGSSSGLSPVTVIGLDSREFLDAVLAGRDSDRITRVIQDGLAIDLSGLFNETFVGTHTRVRIMDSLRGKNYDGTVHFGVTGVKGGHLTIGSIIGGSGSDVQQLHVGAASLGENNGIVELTGANVHQNTSLLGGVLRVGHAQALGTGTLFVEGDNNGRTLSSNSTTGYSVANAINLSGVDLQLGEKGSTVFGSGSLRRNTLTLTGTINGNGDLYVVNGRTILAPAAGQQNAYGYTFAEKGVLIFGNALARPNGTANVSSNYEGYIGIGYLPENLQNEFIGYFDTYSYGTIGFDTIGTGMNSYSGAINLTSLYSGPRLGSSTVAELTGVITPGSSGYAFGGGGGTLYVASALTGSRSLRVESPNVAPLTLWLTNAANTYTGYTTVTNSALVFGAGALPTASMIGVQQGGYVGTTSSADLATFFARFSSSTQSDRFVGFDATGTDTHVFSAPLVLTGTPIPNFYVGTTTKLLFTSTSGITTPTNTYRLAGYKGGAVTLEFPIASGNVIVGEPTTPATHGTESVRSSVTLNGNSTFAGGTTLYTGTLAVGHNNALGTGALTVEGNHFGGNVSPLLVASVSGIQLANSVVLNAELYIGSANHLTLSGVVSGSHELYKIGTGDLFLTGANTFSGGIYIAQGRVVFQNAASVGQGPLQFGSSFTGSATFLEDTTIQGVFSDSTDKAIGTTAGKTLSINQTFNATYAGIFLGTGTLVFKNTSGTPTRLRLSGNSAGNFSGASRIESGVTVIAAHNNAFGTGAVEINGGKLAADSNRVISNPLTLTAGSLGGSGTFAPAATLTIGSNVALAPGTGTGPAAMNFSNTQLGGASGGIVLTLAGGGTYQWQFMEGSGLSGLQPADGRWDTVSVTGGVNVTATSGNRFTFKLTTIASDGNLGLAGNFNNQINQSWTVLNATSITGFNAASFALDTTSFQNSLNGGTFSLGLNGSTSLVLNFAAVPEPSTYALLSAGLLVVIALRRRKRA